MPKIAGALGISPQAVHQQVNKVAARTGDKALLKRGKYNRNKATQFRECLECGRMVRRSPANFNQYNKHFCSLKCSSEFRRKIKRSQLNNIIQMRLNNMTWAGIGKVYKCTAQCIQIRLWRDLYFNGLLTEDIVHKVWAAPNIKNQARRPGWLWLINKTGIEPGRGLSIGSA